MKDCPWCHIDPNEIAALRKALADYVRHTGIGSTLLPDVVPPSLDADVAELRARIAELEALLKRKSAALEEAKRALRFVCHECDVDDVRTRPACWDALARIESLEHGKTNDA